MMGVGGARWDTQAARGQAWPGGGPVDPTLSLRASRLHNSWQSKRTAHLAAPSTSAELPNDPPQTDRQEQKKASLT